ncbi:DUF4118 domain-containing protein [Streptosporangium subroseum]|uniref:sensor histidine kinase n=1 Tax=Streptosporangium subroseum TaxID=106412 RepID=UPI0034289467
MVGALCVAAEIFLTNSLEHVSPGSGSSLGVVYMLGVLTVSAVWGMGLGIMVLATSSFAYDYFDLPPLQNLEVPGTWGWVPLPLFFVVGLLISSIAALVRSLTAETNERRRDADLAAELAHLLLRTKDLRSALPIASRRLAQALEMPNLTIERGKVVVDKQHRALPLRDNGGRLGTLVLPADLPEATQRRLYDRMLPSLEALLRAAHDREAIEIALEASRDELRRIAEEQAGLRRIATLVARGTPPAELFNAVACEMGLIMKVDRVAIRRYEPDHTTLVGSWSAQNGPDFALPIGSCWPLDEPSVSSLVLRTGRPARMTDRDRTDGEISAWARSHGIVFSVGCPILVEAYLWGVVVASSLSSGPRFEGAEERMLDFTELVAIAILNAQTRTELAASRARVVAASDETRRRIERDLHDGAQQRLVSLGLELRSAETTVPPQMSRLREQLSQTVQGLMGVMGDLQELSRGLHPPILSKGGLEPALQMLTRRSAVPVELEVRADRRLPEPVEVAIYYIASEALTNVAKHAHASIVHIAFSLDEAAVQLSINDDGIGGADSGRGSGLIGLSDRVETLGGTIKVTSPVGGGTSLLVKIPVQQG